MSMSLWRWHARRRRLRTTEAGTPGKLVLHEVETNVPPDVATAILRDPNREFTSANNMAGTISREDAVKMVTDEERKASERAAAELIGEDPDAVHG